MLARAKTWLQDNWKPISGAILSALVLLAANLYIDVLSEHAQSYDKTAIRNADQFAVNAERHMRNNCYATASVKENLNCITEAKNSIRQNQISEYELAAQRSDALWNSVMGKAAVIGIALGLVSIWLIFVTFWEARRAANAGFESNDIARQSSERELRAYISITPNTLTIKNRGLRGMSVQVLIKNYGSTPAYELIHGGNIVALTKDEAERFFAPQAPVKETGEISPNTLHSKSEIIGELDSADEFTKVEIDDIYTGKKKLYAYGFARYKDVFDNNRISEFCFAFADGTQIKTGGLETLNKMAWLQTKFLGKST